MCCDMYTPKRVVARGFSTLRYVFILSGLLLGDSPRLGLCVNLSELLLGDSPRSGMFASELAVARRFSTLRCLQ